MPPVGKVERAPGADERRQHHGRPRPRQLRHLPHRRACRALGVGGYLGKFFPLRRVPERDRRRPHRHVRRAHRVHARVRQAGHAGDATLRQHLRRRGGARRHHRRSRSRSSRSRIFGLELIAQRSSRRSSSASSPSCSRSLAIEGPPRGGARGRHDAVEAMPEGARAPATTASTPPSRRAPDGRSPSGPRSSRPGTGAQEEGTPWSTSERASPRSASSAPASASAS